MNHRPELNLKFSIPRPTPYMLVSNLLGPIDERFPQENFPIVPQREFQVLLSSFYQYSLEFRSFRLTIIADNFSVNQGKNC